MIRQSRCFSSHQIIHILDASCTICRIINEKSVETPRVHTKRGGVLIVHMLVYSGMPVARERSMAWQCRLCSLYMSPNRVYNVDSLLPQPMLFCVDVP
jgi:hypothetical protein